MTKVVDRLQPALLDRLTDDEPANAAEAPERRFMSRARLREAVLRDLAWLFNTAAPSDDFARYPAVAASVLNYGLPPLSGVTTSSIDPSSLEAFVRKAIVAYEPRILPHTLHVEAVVSELQIGHHNKVSLRIAGQLWAQPVPLELLLRTDVDLETGRIEIAELSR